MYMFGYGFLKLFYLTQINLNLSNWAMRQQNKLNCAL